MKQFYFGSSIIITGLLLFFFSLFVKGPAYYFIISGLLGLLGYMIIKDAPYEEHM